MVDGGGWRAELDRWLEPFVAELNHAARRTMCPHYVAGLIGLGERKSMQPMAARQDGLSYDRLQHFISVGRWDDAPLTRALLAEADRMVGGRDAVLVIDDTSLPKKGRHSVGVAPQYLSTQGKIGNCQAMVSLTLARREVPVLVGLRLFLPATWTDDAVRMKRAGVPEAAQAPRTKPEIALDEVDRVRAAGVRFGVVLADAGYGCSATFRAGLSARGLAWASGRSIEYQGVPGRREAAARRAEAGAPVRVPASRQGVGAGRDRARAGQVAFGDVAFGHQGAAEGALRRRAGARRGRLHATHRGQGEPASARRRCGFRSKPATDSEMKPAAIPI